MYVNTNLHTNTPTYMVYLIIDKSIQDMHTHVYIHVFFTLNLPSIRSMREKETVRNSEAEQEET